jgi:NADH:ubiquinone oxidoreductase subunit E
MNANESAVLDEIISSIPDARWGTIKILQETQRRFAYLRDDHMRHLAAKMGISYTDLYGVATFYSQFNLAPPGKHTIHVCEGTACHVKGGKKLRGKLKELLGIDVKETTANGEFSLRSVRCLGCCGIAPVVMIDDETFGRVRPAAVAGIVEGFK